jgi:hypothetical protein
MQQIMQEQLMVFYKITEFQIDIHTLFTKISKDPYIQYFQSQIFDFISFITYFYFAIVHRNKDIIINKVLIFILS